MIGGTSLFGGRGSIVGTLVGALIVGVFSNGLALAGADALWQEFTVGVLIIVAVVDRPVAPEALLVSGEVPQPILTARGLVKRYGRVTALDHADFDLMPGEILGVIGDNGAGKSTLIKALAGAVTPDHGEIRLDGRPVHFRSPLDARAAGIETVYQDLALSPALSIADNLFLGRERRRPDILGRLFRTLDRAGMRKDARRHLNALGLLTIQSISQAVETLSGGQRQGVAVVRATAFGSRVVIMDEPTAALGVKESRKVLELILDVKRRGLPIVLISHNMPHVFEVADRIHIHRLGRRIAVIDPRDLLHVGCRGDHDRRHGPTRGPGSRLIPRDGWKRGRRRSSDRSSCTGRLDTHLPSMWMARGWFIMADNVHELRPKAGDSEKITINLGYVDLGHIDLLVQEGFYSNRTDLIRTAIRNLLDRHADVTRRSAAQKSLDLGLRHFSRADLEAVREAGQRLEIRVLGLASIATDVTAELASATIASVVVLGAFQASPAVKAALADRMR